MSNSPQVPEQPSKPADRRSSPRRIPDTLTYIDLGIGNGGIVLNVSEGGLRLASAKFIYGDANPPIRLRLPGTGEWIETPGQIVWTSKSRKEAGVRFVGLAKSDRDRIRNWMALEASRIQLDNDAHKIVERQPEPDNAPKTIEPKGHDPSPAAVENADPDRNTVSTQNKDSEQNSFPHRAQPPVSPVSTPDTPRSIAREPIFSGEVPIEEPLPIDDASPADDLSRIHATIRAQVQDLAPIEEPSGEADLQAWRNPAERRTVINRQVGVWLTAISLGSLIAIISFILGMAVGRGAWSDILGIFGVGQGSGNRAVEPGNRGGPASAPEAATNAPEFFVENMPFPLPAIARGPSLEIPVPRLRQTTTPRRPAIAPVPRAPATIAPAIAIPEPVNTIPAPATEVEKVPPPQSAPPENPRPQ
jgi:hypothetical protein